MGVGFLPDFVVQRPMYHLNAWPVSGMRLALASDEEWSTADRRLLPAYHSAGP